MKKTLCISFLVCICSVGHAQKWHPEAQFGLLFGSGLGNADANMMMAEPFATGQPALDAGLFATIGISSPKWWHTFEASISTMPRFDLRLTRTFYANNPISAWHTTVAGQYFLNIPLYRKFGLYFSPGIGYGFLNEYFKGSFGSLRFHYGGIVFEARNDFGGFFGDERFLFMRETWTFRIAKSVSLDKNKETRFTNPDIEPEEDNPFHKRLSRNEYIRIYTGSNVFGHEPTTNRAGMNISLLFGFESYVPAARTALFFSREVAAIIPHGFSSSPSTDRAVLNITELFGLHHYLKMKNRYLRLGAYYVSATFSDNDVKENDVQYSYFPNRGVAVGAGYPLTPKLEVQLRTDIFLRTVNEMQTGFNLSRLRFGVQYLLF